MLPLCGSNPAALMIKNLILNGDLTDTEARRAVTFLPYYLRLPSEKLLAEYEILLDTDRNPKIKYASLFTEKLFSILNAALIDTGTTFQRELRSAILLSFGHLVGVTCSNENRPCSEATVERYSRMAFEAHAAAETHQEKMLTLLTLRSTNLMGAIEQLIPFTKSGVVSHSLRPHIIYSLQAGVNRNKLITTILPIIGNQTEPTEVRVAAVITLLNAHPTLLELQKLIAGVMWEKNPEVANFIITAFKVSLLIVLLFPLQIAKVYFILFLFIESRRLQDSLWTAV